MMNMNMMNMMNMNMNFNMQNEILKSVLEGMGEQPSDDMEENWNSIMNFDANLQTSKCNNNNLNKGKLITLTFSPVSGGQKELKIGEDTQMKILFEEYIKISGINTDIKKIFFLAQGKTFDVNTAGTIKENGLKDKYKLIVLINSQNN